VKLDNEKAQCIDLRRPYAGRIINNGSLAAHVPRPHSVAYAASKHAVHGLTKTIAIEGRKHNISVTQIDIGAYLENIGGG
jgi:NAD(P)-dependent dehydrogenase (short-subunit alcohol dehydrogenase family)